jgi:hypothetical protein
VGRREGRPGASGACSTLPSVSWLRDAAVIAIPSATAFAGAWYGSRLKFRQERKAELARLLDEAAKVLERADQRRGAVYAMFVQDGANTSPQGLEALQAFRAELSMAAQLRAQIAVSEAPTSPVYEAFSSALDGLGDISIAAGVAAMWPNDRHYDAPLMELNERIEAGASTFAEKRPAFQEAARKRLRP